MSDEICWLVTVLYEGTLLKCALRVKKAAVSQDCQDFPMEPENREAIRALLPLHVRSCGPVVAVDDLFAVEVL